MTKQKLLAWYRKLNRDFGANYVHLNRHQRHKYLVAENKKKRCDKHQADSYISLNLYPFNGVIRKFPNRYRANAIHNVARIVFVSRVKKRCAM